MQFVQPIQLVLPVRPSECAGLADPVHTDRPPEWPCSPRATCVKTTSYQKKTHKTDKKVYKKMIKFYIQKLKKYLSSVDSSVHLGQPGVRIIFLLRN